MSAIKDRLRQGEAALGAWVMIGHPAVGELLAGEAFDWVAVDLEHAAIDLPLFSTLALAIKSRGKEVLARLHSPDAVLAKQVLDAGADGIIVPMVNSRQDAERAVAMARFPPQGQRGASLCRATDYGRNFPAYYAAHNTSVVVVAILEDIHAARNADEIVSTPGLDAVMIGPYDLSASMGLAGQLNHPAVLEAQEQILDACQRHRVAPGIHVVPVDAEEVRQRIAQGYRFLACGLDTGFIIHGCRAILAKVRPHA